MTDEAFMKKAIALAQKAYDNGDYPCGCVIVKDGKIIARAKTTGFVNKNPTEHAELLALSKASKLGEGILRGATIYDSVEPCLMCAQAMAYAHIKRVVYAAEHGEYGAKNTFTILKENGIARDIEVTGGVEKEKVQGMVNQFLAKNKPFF